MMSNAFWEFIKSPNTWFGDLLNFISDIATAAPNSSKTMETVVEVGKPKVLNKSSKMTSVSMTAKKINISSGIVKNLG